MELKKCLIFSAIESSNTGGNSTAIVIVPQVTSDGCLSNQIWMTSESLSVLRLLSSHIFSRSP